MKKVLLGVAAIMAITSCSESEEFENEGKQAAISFGSIVRNSTRADIVTTATFDKFVVSGYTTPAEMGEDTQLNMGFIDNLDVAKSGETWAYAGESFYWPYIGKVQFFATQPAQTLNVATAGYPTFDYTIKAVANQEDLVAANLVDKDKTSGALIFPFQHLLTQVNFSIKGDTPGFTYTVSRIELKGLKDGGTFKFDGTSTVGAWNNLTAAFPTLVYDCTTTVTPAADLTAKTDFEASGKALFMLMPQDASAVTLNITYTTVKGTIGGFSGTKTVALTGDWKQGHSIRYILKLTSDTTPVSFGAPSVGEWVPNVNDVDVEK